MNEYLDNEALRDLLGIKAEPILYCAACDRHEGDPGVSITTCECGQSFCQDHFDDHHCDFRQ